MIRDIVQIDEDKCDGCGLCVPSCHEGAIQIINGKAKVVADRLCDGMGACLGHCPRGAIEIEKREAPEFDEAAVEHHLAKLSRPSTAAVSKQAVAAVHQAKSGNDTHGHGGCPGSRLQMFPHTSEPRPQGRGSSLCSAGPTPSELTHWPIQLRLLPAHAPVLRGASLLIAADCVPVAYADFQQNLLRGRAVLIGCPKFDDLASYVEKLTEIFAQNDLAEVVVARMEVPCCGGILSAVLEARRLTGSTVVIRDVVIGVRGQLLTERGIPA